MPFWLQVCWTWSASKDLSEAEEPVTHHLSSNGHSTGRLRLSIRPAQRYEFAARLSPPFTAESYRETSALVTTQQWSFLHGLAADVGDYLHFQVRILDCFGQLNQELGALCQAPPSQLLKVCRLHARIVRR